MVGGNSGGSELMKMVLEVLVAMVVVEVTVR